LRGVWIVWIHLGTVPEYVSLLVGLVIFFVLQADGIHHKGWQSMQLVGLANAVVVGVNRPKKTQRIRNVAFS
jgi:hypothetical protein